MQLQNRNFKTITNANTIAQWVDAFNNNSLTGSDMQFMIGEATFSSVLYTGLETIGNGVNAYGIEAWKDIAPEFRAVFPDDIVLDNWYVYFRNLNRFILISQLHVDLTDYSKYDNNEFVQGDLYHFFINYELGFRISHSPIPKLGEIRLFRFIATSSSISQLIPTFSRYFYAGNNVDYEEVTGMDVQPSGANGLGTNDGWVDYDGIAFDNHSIPDKKYYESGEVQNITIKSGGRHYKVRDVVPTNIVGTNARVLATSNPGDEDTYGWNASTIYQAGDKVQFEYIEWEAREENQGFPPDELSTKWVFSRYMDTITECEITKDPINHKGGDADIEIILSGKPWDLLYNTYENKLDYSLKTRTVDGSKVMDYQNNSIDLIEPGKYTIQRIHLDYLTNTLVIQYGDTIFDTMRDALDSIYSLSFPFVYNTYIFPVLAYMVVRSDYTDLNDTNQCVIVQIRTRSTDIRDSENLAVDSWARALITKQAEQIKQINAWLERLQRQTDELRRDFNAHISNNFPTPLTIKDGNNQNPHRVTKAEVGLGNVDNISVENMTVPSTIDVANGNTKGTLKHVRIALDNLDKVLRNYVDITTGKNDITDGSPSVVKWVDKNFLYKTRSDSTSPNTHHQIRHIVTGDQCIIFNNPTTLGENKPTPTTAGVAWFVGDLPATDYEAYGVKKS